MILAVLAGVVLAGVVTWHLQKNRAVESRTEAAQPAAKKPVQPKSPDPEPDIPVGSNEEVRSEPARPTNLPSSYQALKELETASETEPGSSVENLEALLARDPTDEAAAIACRFIFNKAGDRQALPDYALQELYAGQRNPDLKRVIAQVLSQRGDDALLKDQIAGAQAALKSSAPRDRLDALNHLGKIHSVQAVDAIAPSLQDPDSTVRVAALFALRDSGNEQHIYLAEPLTRDPDPSVSTLAANVTSALKNLSSSAHTRYSRADIEAELPPIANP